MVLCGHGLCLSLGLSQAVMDMEINQWPIVESRAPNRVFVDTKTERLNQVQHAARSRAQARDIASIGRYLRLYENYVKWPRSADRAQALVRG
jgi:hypothetical protein